MLKCRQNKMLKAVCSFLFMLPSKKMRMTLCEPAVWFFYTFKRHWISYFATAELDVHVAGYECVLKVRFNQFLLMITRVYPARLNISKVERCCSLLNGLKDIQHLDFLSNLLNVIAAVSIFVQQRSTCWVAHFNIQHGMIHCSTFVEHPLQHLLINKCWTVYHRLCDHSTGLPSSVCVVCCATSVA